MITASIWTFAGGFWLGSTVGALAAWGACAWVLRRTRKMRARAMVSEWIRSTATDQEKFLKQADEFTKQAEALSSKAREAADAIQDLNNQTTLRNSHNAIEDLA